MLDLDLTLKSRLGIRKTSYEILKIVLKLGGVGVSVNYKSRDYSCNKESLKIYRKKLCRKFVNSSQVGMFYKNFTRVAYNCSKLR